MNNDCKQSCSICQHGYKQFLCCYKIDGYKNQITIEDLSILMEQIKKSNIYKFNIIGGNLFSYRKLYELVKYLNYFQVKKDYYIHYLNIEDYADFFRLLKEGNNQLNVIIHFPIETNIFPKKMKVLRQVQNGASTYFNFVIQCEKDIDAAEALISEFQIEEFHFIPCFNGNNIDFFRENVFLDRESILKSQPDMRDIFAQTSINTSDFKKLVVLSDKSIYANLNNPTMGSLGKNHIFEIIYKELQKGKSWTKVRKNVTPCKSCVYNALCPPISNYEYAIGRNNLCNIWKNQR